MNITDKPNLEQAIELCKIIHIALGGKYFPALTGGQLYKEGDRKDIDIVVYRHRQDTKDFEMTDIFETLEVIGFENLECYGFVSKGKWKGLNVDLFNPEEIPILVATVSISPQFSSSL